MVKSFFWLMFANIKSFSLMFATITSVFTTIMSVFYGGGAGHGFYLDFVGTCQGTYGAGNSRTCHCAGEQRGAGSRLTSFEGGICCFGGHRALLGPSFQDGGPSGSCG